MSRVLRGVGCLRAGSGTGHGARGRHGHAAAARRYYQTAAAAMDTVPAWADTSWASFMADGAALWRKAGVADSVALLESRRDLIAARATTAAQRAPQAGSR